jgi:riboflavin synthase alpha subunit
MDSGSTHSFIFVTATYRLHLDPIHKPKLHIGVANGDQVACTGICRTVHNFINSD